MKQGLHLRYINRITAIQELLANPPPDISANKALQQASKSIFDLWISYKNDNDFQKELEELIIRRPELIPEFEIIFKELPQTSQNEDAIESLKKYLGIIVVKLAEIETDNNILNSLQGSDTAQPDYQRPESQVNEISSQENQWSLDSAENNLTSRIKVLKILFGILGLFIIVFAYSAGIAFPILVLMTVGLWILLNTFIEK